MTQQIVFWLWSRTDSNVLQSQYKHAGCAFCCYLHTAQLAWHLTLKRCCSPLFSSSTKTHRVRKRENLLRKTQQVFHWWANRQFVPLNHHSCSKNFAMTRSWQMKIYASCLYQRAWYHRVRTHHTASDWCSFPIKRETHAGDWECCRLYCVSVTMKAGCRKVICGFWNPELSMCTDCCLEGSSG